MMDKCIKLAGMVLDWAGYDSVVSDKGWDGGENDSNWDVTRNAMVEFARQIIERGGAEDPESRPLLTISRDLVKRSMSVRVVPACGNARPGHVDIMFCEGDDGSCVAEFKMGFKEVARILSVLKGMEGCVDVMMGSRETMSVHHKIEGWGYDLRYDVRDEGYDDSCGKRTMDSFAIANDEAYALAAAIEGALPAMCFGIGG